MARGRKPNTAKQVVAPIKNHLKECNHIWTVEYLNSHNAFKLEYKEVCAICGIDKAI